MGWSLNFTDFFLRMEDELFYFAFFIYWQVVILDVLWVRGFAAFKILFSIEFSLIF